MSKKREYQVKYALRAVIGITVQAASADEAIVLANKRRDKNLFASGVECLDESSNVIGYDDMEGWNVAQMKEGSRE